MSPERSTATLSDYAAILRRRWRVVALCTAAGIALGGLWVLRSGTQYTSKASVVIRPIQSDPFVTPRIEDVGADTQAKILASTVVARRAAKILDTGQSPEQLLGHLDVTNPLGTLALNVSYTAKTPGAARDGAQAFAQAYLDERKAGAEDTKQRQLDRNAAQREVLASQLNEVINTIRATVPGSDERATAEARRDVINSQLAQLEQSAATVQAVDTDPGQIIRPADLPSSPSGPPRLVTTFAAGVLGAIVGVGIALVRERTDRHIRSHEELVALIGREAIAEIPVPHATRGAALAATAAPSGREAAAYRSLRVRIWPRPGTGPERLLVTSVKESVAAEEVAANLAVTLADAGWSTLLAWAGHSNLVSLFDVEAVPNMEVIVGERPIERELLRLRDVDRLTLLPALGAQGSGRTAVATRTAEARLEQLERRFDAEILVGAPLLRSAESLELCPLVDRTLLVFDPRASTGAELEQALELLAGVGSQVLGVVPYHAPWIPGA